MNMPQNVECDRGTSNLAARQERSFRHERLRIRLAHDSWTRREAFRLRHLCYQSEGYIDPKPNEEFSDEHDFGRRSQTLVLYNGVDAIGSVRVCLARRADGEKLPLASTFPAEFEDLFKPHQLAVEINRLVCHPSHSQGQVVFTLIRMADYLIREIDPGFITICVRSNHVGFWKRLRFQNVAGPRTYAGLKFPTNLLALPSERCDVVRRVVPMLRISEAESAAYGRLQQSETVQVFGHE